MHLLQYTYMYMYTYMYVLATLIVFTIFGNKSLALAAMLSKSVLNLMAIKATPHMFSLVSTHALACTSPRTITHTAHHRKRQRTGEERKTDHTL